MEKCRRMKRPQCVCQRIGYMYSDTVQYGELRSDRGSWFINEFFLKLAFFNIHDTLKARN